MDVEVRYSTEFGSSATVIDVTEIPSFAKRFKMLSVKPIETKYSEDEVKQAYTEGAFAQLRYIDGKPFVTRDEWFDANHKNK